MTAVGFESEVRVYDVGTVALVRRPGDSCELVPARMLEVRPYAVGGPRLLVEDTTGALTGLRGSRAEVDPGDAIPLGATGPGRPAYRWIGVDAVFGEDR